ncbi:MAG: DUF3160 domain-containing protein [Patescibacteria group bacterium]|jgi:hypothetical protein|nr:DUF3160 domain-containing protein [Patescibacteria group bacterium]
MSKDYEDNYSDYSTTEIKNSSNDFLKKILVIAGAVIFVLIIVAFVIIAIFSGPEPKSSVIAEPIEDSNSIQCPPSGCKLLPSLDPDASGTTTPKNKTDIQAEALFFADFYVPEEINFDYQISTYELPINSKSDVLNYYDISKKIELESYLDMLNNDGVAIIDNIYNKETNDFYSVYEKLNSEEIPMLITSDFIMYYYQNILKQSFKEIEKSVFYENLWNITKKFYEISSTRYKQDFAEKGIVNDPVLEGEKLEASYFAVMLELLKPTKDQINRKTNFSDETKFSEQEAMEFDFVLLDYLKNDVLAEVELIREGRKIEKSPVFFYEKNYRDYNIPDDYSNNAKLNNFYLVTKWMNSVFPLYFQDEQCPDCLLDKEDWRISITAANLIARDFFENQDLKNEWASVYKIISFFSGLRQDLSYLDFRNVFNDEFGERSVEDVFSRENENWNDDYIKFQDKILEIKFSELEGSYNRNSQALKNKVGMRMLQENYWPNDFIFSSLTGEEIAYKKESRDEPFKFTACEGEKDKNFRTRCVSMGLDVINLVYPLEYFDYYYDNTDYPGYYEAQNLLNSRLSNFNKYSWQNNIYWSTLDTLGVYLNTPKQSLPIFMSSDKWQEKDINTSLGSWVNLHLPADKLVINNSRTASSLSFGAECNKYNYLEPNITLVNELIAKTNMLSEMLTALKLAEKTNVVSVDLKELKENLLTIKNLIRKELDNEELGKIDCEFLEEFTRIYTVEKFAEKEFMTIFDTGARLRESISGVKLLSVVQSFGENKVILVGPIFNYQENR